MSDKELLAVAVRVRRQFESSGLTANQLIELEDAIDAAVREHERTLQAENQRLREALAWIYDKWENGDSCYEDPETCSGFMGRAFKIEYEEENAILGMIGDTDAALSQEPPR
jgi:hypothetical protein